MQITASDVIHSFAVPALWFKLDAIPGPDQREGALHREAGRLLRPVLGTVRRQARLHADRGRSAAARGIQRAGCWRSRAARSTACPSRPKPPATPAAKAAAPAAPAAALCPLRRPLPPLRRLPPKPNQTKVRTTWPLPPTTSRLTMTRTGMPDTITSPASSPAGSCRPTTRTSARSICSSRSSPGSSAAPFPG